MTRHDLVPLLHAERAELADALQDLPDQDWELPSLCAGWTVHDVLAHLTAASRASTSSAAAAPFGVREGMLGEVVVHSQDIARPLGLPLVPSREAVNVVAEFFARKDFAVNSSALVRGLRLEAADDEFTAGDGPVLRGPLLALVMAMAGRPVALDELKGDGLGILRERLPRALTRNPPVLDGPGAPEASGSSARGPAQSSSGSSGLS